MKLVKPLAQQWLTRMLLWMAAYTAVVLAAHWYADRQQQEAELTAIPRQIQQQFMPLLAQSVWDVDSDMSARLLQGMLDIQGVVHVSISSYNGQLLMQRGQLQLVSHQIELPILSGSNGEQALGALHLSLSLRKLEQQQWQHLALLLGELLLGWLLIAALGYRHLQQHVVQPLQALSAQWLQDDKTPPAKAIDELAQLKASLASHALHTQQQQQLQLQERQELAQQRDHLSSLLAMRTAELEQLSRFHQMISEMSSRLMQLNSASLQGEIAIALARIGTLLDVDRCYLFRVSSAMRIHQNQEWCRSGVPSTAQRYEDYPLHDSAWFIPQLLKQHLVAISQLEDMPPEGQTEKQRFAQHGIQSLAVVTLSSQGQVLGFFGCDSVLQKREWQDKELTLMRLFSEMLCSALLQQQLTIALDHSRQQLAEATEQLHNAVNVDGLTGLSNAATLLHQLQQAFQQAQQTGQPLSLLLVDIDQLRELNHLAGPQAGDHCIQRIARLLQQRFSTRGSLVARSGGNRFSVLLPAHTLRDALEQSEGLREAVLQLAIAHAGKQPPNVVTVSIGVSSQEPQLHHNAEALLEEARRSLQQAKLAGRNRVACTQMPGQPG